MVKGLEKLIDVKIKPLLEEAMHKNLGVTVAEIEDDISDRLLNPLLEFDIDTSMSFKEAKKSFKRQYISKLLKVRFGNVAEVAKIAKVDRRSIHRFVAEMKVDVKKLRESSLYMKEVAVQNIIQEALEQYKGALNPVKYQAMYREAPTLSKDIAKELPELPSSLKQAERDFEKRFLTRALKENKWNISKTARKIGLRFETLHRKMKDLGIKKNE